LAANDLILDGDSIRLPIPISLEYINEIVATSKFLIVQAGLQLYLW